VILSFLDTADEDLVDCGSSVVIKLPTIQHTKASQTSFVVGLFSSGYYPDHVALVNEH